MPALYMGREAFEPETIRILAAAFEDAWQSLNDGPTELGPHTDATRSTLATGIILAAMSGERDPQKLRDAALTHLAEATQRNAEAKSVPLKDEPMINQQFRSSRQQRY